MREQRSGADSCLHSEVCHFGEFGEFAAVPSNWEEKYDPIDGLKKLLAYTSGSQASSHVFVTSCESGHLVFLAAQVTEEASRSIRS